MSQTAKPSLRSSKPSLSKPSLSKPSLKSISKARRQTVNLSSESLVKVEPLDPGSAIPMLVRPTVEGLSLLAWARDHQGEVDRLLLEHRALLFRGFEFRGVDQLNAFIHATSRGGLLEYKDRSSPRHAVAEKIYTSTDYPADQQIFLHNEGSYWQNWPLKVYFYCDTAAEKRGETPIADCRRVLAAVDPEVRRRFEEKGVMYVRNFNDGYGLDWPTVFQTDDPEEVNAYCAANGIEAEWKENGRLRTRQVRHAVAEHPTTGETLWFNHGTFFHVTTLPESVRNALLAQFSEEDLPYQTYYGDGSPIEPEVVAGLREAYESAKVSFPWQEGDLLLLDNMTVAHGRNSYEGARKILAGLAEPRYAAAEGGSR